MTNFPLSFPYDDAYRYEEISDDDICPNCNKSFHDHDNDKIVKCAQEVRFEKKLFSHACLQVVTFSNCGVGERDVCESSCEVACVDYLQLSGCVDVDEDQRPFVEVHLSLHNKSNS